MPKHIPSELYLASPQEIVHKGIVHPKIEHRPSDTENYLLPAVFAHAKETALVTVKYPGPGVLYITDGELQYEDTTKPSGTPTVLSTGAVLHIEEGSVLRWSSSSGVKGFGVFYVPASIKGFEAFVVPE